MKRRRRRHHGRAAFPKIGTTDPRGMQAGAINAELDRLEKLSSKVSDKLIAAGRGYERSSDTWAMNPADDALTLEWQAVSARRDDLRHEIARRMGPGHYSRLPRGFGPIKRPT